MKKTITLVFILLVISLSNAQNSFYKECYETKYSNEKKTVLFLFRHDCPYCINMETLITSDSNFQKQLKSDYNIEFIDISTNEGRLIANKYAITAVPTVLKFNSKSEVPEKLKGFGTITRVSNFLNLNISQNIQTNLKNIADVCGNGIVESTENCDDANTTSGDGCNGICNVEPGFTCTGTPSVCIPSVCGNGIIEAGETCDDGNSTSGDGCSLACQTEVCGNGILDFGETCDDGNTTSGDGCSATCQADSICGNGIIEAGEQCDDLNLVNGDGCENNCQLTPICGNGIVESTETCDDANTTSGDGCNGICNVEPGFTCTGTPSVCIPSVCGNGIIEAGEQCDDGNLVNGDGCENTCQLTTNCGNGIIEAGEQCDDGNLVNGDGCENTCQLTPICGDGIIAENEQCDDGNTTDGDGCASSCSVETGYTCIGSPSVCISVCGDGIITGSEQCDDGNLVNGDGCENTCQLTPICGNGIIDLGETCDDGNVQDGDGCSSICQIEIIQCGDGSVSKSESCDDGNTTSGDGCDATCNIEPGFTCIGSPSVCTSTLNSNEVENSENLITIIPNPTNNYIIVLGNRIENFDYIIVDITGRTIKSGYSKFDEKISLENFSSGNYIIQIQTESELKINKKIIKD